VNGKENSLFINSAFSYCWVDSLEYSFRFLVLL